jgi:RimJ/RimL family protein N-acetyltransferase
MLMDLAEERAGVRHFVLAISPTNAPSLAIARKLGFVRTGERIDKERGLEHVFELKRNVKGAYRDPPACTPNLG